jgi:pyrroloquinoline-quinone synthase
MSDTLRERLLAVMDRKDHWAWPRFAAGEVPREALRAHFEQEWATYVRDFPVLLARVLGHGPPDDVRVALAANLYEEQTGGVSGSAPHPELFLRMMEGCGYARADFERVALLPEAAAYRAFLDDVTWRGPWIVGCAVMTIFVEGSVHDRRELAVSDHAPPDEDTIARVVAQHPLVRVHGVPPAAMELVRVHRRVEGGHRHDAWRSVLAHARPEDHDALVHALEHALALWLLYRDGVARACGLSR